MIHETKAELVTDKELKMLVIGNPFYFIGGAPRRTYEVVKAYSELGIEVKIYIPYGQLFLTKLLQTIHNIKNQEVYSTLRDLEKSGIEISSEVYTQLEAMEEEIWEHYIIMKKGGVRWILENLKKLLFLINKRTVEDVHAFIKENFAKRKGSDVNLIYVTDATFLDMIYTGYFISEALRRKFFVLFQSIPLTSIKELIAEEFWHAKHFFEKNIFRNIIRTFIITIEKAFFKHETFRIFNHCAKNLAGLLSVSDAPIKIAKLDEWAYRRGIPIRVLRPGNAVNVELQKYFKEREKFLNSKEDYAIFYARLDVVKGILEIPFIAKHLQQNGYTMLLAGRFDNPNVREKFETLCRVLNVKNIRYLGYLPDKRLWQVVAKGKVLIYPSHCDVFPLVTLESLFLGNSVVAYNIPAVSSIYRDLQVVKIVEKYSWRKMAEEAVKILKTNLEKFVEEHKNENLIKFLELHSSWKNVAKAEICSMCEIMRDKA